MIVIGARNASWSRLHGFTRKAMQQSISSIVVSYHGQRPETTCPARPEA